jgi:hypothetical protein
MRKFEIRVSWKVPCICVLSVSKRERINLLGVKEEYAVIGIGTISDFDDLTLESFPRNRKVKVLSLMCFIPSIYNNVHEGQMYVFKGKVGFGYGNTYLTVEEACLPNGFPLVQIDEEYLEEEDDCPPPLAKD